MQIPRRMGIPVALGPLVYIGVAWCLIGCQAADEKPGVAASAGGIIKTIDASGTIRRNEEISRAADALAAKIGELDMDSVNCTISELAALVAALEERIEALPPDLGQSLDEQVRGAQLQRVSEQLQETLALLSARLEALDTRSLHEEALRTNETVAAAAEEVKSVVATVPGYLESGRRTMRLANGLVVVLSICGLLGAWRLLRNRR